MRYTKHFRATCKKWIVSGQPIYYIVCSQCNPSGERCKRRLSEVWHPLLGRAEADTLNDRCEPRPGNARQGNSQRFPEQAPFQGSHCGVIVYAPVSAALRNCQRFNFVIWPTKEVVVSRNCQPNYFARAMFL